LCYLIGKTLQILGSFLALREKHGIIGPHLIVVPLSVITSWTGEVEKFAGREFRVYVHQGTKEDRDEEFYNFNRRSYRQLEREIQIRAKPPITLMIFTYDTIIKDLSMMRRLYKPIDYLVVDEAHRIKRQSCVLYQVLSRIPSSRRLLITGTPLQNNFKELISLLNFIVKRDVLEQFELFESIVDRQFDEGEIILTKDIVDSLALSSNQEDTEEGTDGDSNDSDTIASIEDQQSLIQKLQDLLRPYLLRRTKAEVCLDLPPKIEKIIFCPQSPLQIEIHLLLKKIMEHEIEQELQRKNRSSLAVPFSLDVNTIFTSEEFTFNNVIMQLRKICNHSFLFLEDIQSIPDHLYFEQLLSCSGKLSILDRLLDQLLRNGHKVSA
jgi:SNF2 family DNA or RNA helicase